MMAALVVMTIMGCDDSATHCHYIETVGETWHDVELCDAQAERQMDRHQDRNYPVIVAVCETAANRVSAEAAEPVGEAMALTPQPDTVDIAAVEAEREKNLARRALDIVSGVIPDRTTLSALVTTPVRYAGEGYSWVVKRFVD